MITLAVKDLELLTSIDKKNPQAKKDLVELKTQLKKEKESGVKI